MERALIEYLANSAWQLPLLAGGAWLLLRIARPEPLAQHWVWVAVLAMAVVLPLRGMVRGHVAAGPVDAGFTAAPAQSAIAPMPASLPPQHAEQQRGEGWTPLAAEMQNIRVNATAMLWLMWIYVGAVFLGGLRLAWAWRAARRLVEHSREMVFPGRAMEGLQKYGRRLGVELPRVRGSSEVLSPVVVGAWKPVLLLPENFLEHTDEEIQAALCHELAHVRRRDTLANMLCQAMALPLVWHPATYAVQRRIHTSREMVCDAMAAEAMRSEKDYARCLVALAASMFGGDGLGQTQVGLFDNNTLEERVMRLTKTKIAMSTRARVVHLAGGATVMAAALAMAAMFHLTPTLAQAASPATPPGHSASTAPAVSSGEGMSTGQGTSYGQGASSSSGEGVSSGGGVSSGRGMSSSYGEGQSVSVGQGMSTGKSGSAKGELGISGLTAVAHGKYASVTAGKGEYIHRWTGSDGKPYVIANDQRREPTLEERRRIEAAFARRMAKMVHDQMSQMKNELQGLNLPELQQQVKDATGQVNSPEFKKQMAEMQKQMQNGELQRSAQMAAMRAQMRALKLPDIRLQMQAATAQMDSSELEQEMAEVQKAVQRGELQRAKAIQILKDAQTQLEKMQTK